MDGQTDGKVDPAQKYIYLLLSETLSSTCYILCKEITIVFYFTSNGYNNLSSQKLA